MTAIGLEIWVGLEIDGKEGQVKSFRVTLWVINRINADLYGVLDEIFKYIERMTELWNRSR